MTRERAIGMQKDSKPSKQEEESDSEEEEEPKIKKRQVERKKKEKKLKEEKKGKIAIDGICRKVMNRRMKINKKEEEEKNVKWQTKKTKRDVENLMPEQMASDMEHWLGAYVGTYDLTQIDASNLAKRYNLDGKLQIY